MLFRKRYDRALQRMHEKNNEYLHGTAADRPEEPDPEAELAEAEQKAREFHQEEKLELEKGDIAAMILSAMLVFGPILLILSGILAAAWILLN